MILPNLPMILQALKARAAGDPMPVPMGHGSPPVPMGAQGPTPSPVGSQAPAGGGGAQSESRALVYLKQMIDAGNQYMQAEPDPEDRATMAKVLATLHEYQAKDQKERDAATGASPATKLIRRQSRQNGAY